MLGQKCAMLGQEFLTRSFCGFSKGMLTDLSVFLNIKVTFAKVSIVSAVLTSRNVQAKHIIRSHIQIALNLLI